MSMISSSSASQSYMSYSQNCSYVDIDTTSKDGERDKSPKGKNEKFDLAKSMDTYAGNRDTLRGYADSMSESGRRHVRDPKGNLINKNDGGKACCKKDCTIF